MKQIVKHNIRKNSSYYLSLTIVGTLFVFKIVNCKMIFEHKIMKGCRSSTNLAERGYLWISGNCPHPPNIKSALIISFSGNFSLSLAYTNYWMKKNFDLELLEEAQEFLENLGEKERNKIYYNIRKAQ